MKKSKPKKIVITCIIVVLLILAGTAVAAGFNQAKPAAAGASEQQTAIVTKGSIVSELSSSGVISPKNTYSVTSLIEGEVISADFEEGDLVEKDQVLYQIDPSSMESELESANNSLVRAQENYADAEQEYQKALGEYSGRVYHADSSGYIKTLYIKAGDTVNSGTKIADLYNDQTMKLRVPFLTAEAAQIGVGNEGIVTLADTGETLPGVVTAVSQLEETLSGGRIVRYVTVEVGNPGGLTTTHSASAQINNFLSAAEAVFQPTVDTILTADIGTSVKVEQLLIGEGDYVTDGTPVFRMDSENIEKLIKSYKDSRDQAQESVETAQNKLDTTNDNFGNYTITAPISGQVIKKEAKAGDNITKSSSGSATMATIYDLSEMTFEMSIDELDIRKVAVGQNVTVTADALEGQSFTGTVTNISLESSNANGVTNYPVTVTLTDAGDLLPGMNVDGRIILDQSDDTLLIPVDALMRGNQVYIKDDTVTEAQGNIPAGFRSVEVQTGLISDSFVEITEGLSEGDEVYVAESSRNSGTQMIMPAVGMPGMGGAPAGGGQNRGGGMNGGGPRN